MLVLGADGAPLLASQQPTRRRSLYRAAALSGVFECLVHVQSRSLPQKSFPKQVPRNPEALLAVIRCFWRKGHCGQGVWGNYLNKGNHCPLQESQGPAADPGFIETGRSFFSGMSRRVLEWPFTLLAGHFSQFGTLAFLIS